MEKKKTSRNDVGDTKKWYLVDAKGLVLGRLASKIATILMGKNKATYMPHQNKGDGVIVINAKDVIVKGSNKPRQKTYQKFTYYPGGLNVTTMEQMMKKKPEYVLRHAVKGMLPKNKLSASMLKSLRVYRDDSHKHTAQTPETLKMNES